MLFQMNFEDILNIKKCVIKPTQLFSSSVFLSKHNFLFMFAVLLLMIYFPSQNIFFDNILKRKKEMYARSVYMKKLMTNLLYQKL